MSTDPLKPLTELVEKWRTKAYPAPAEYICADELASTIPIVEAACREPMECGHPKACWVEPLQHPTFCTASAEYQHKHPEIPHCTACARERERVRLERALALREAISSFERFLNNLATGPRAVYNKSSRERPFGYGEKEESFCDGWETAVKAALGPNSDWRKLPTGDDQTALDAHDAEVRDRALEEATTQVERKDCEKALLVLAGWYPTPAETYGTNTSLAISDLCRAIAALRAADDDPNASRLAYEAWHARDAEIADLQRHLEKRDMTIKVMAQAAYESGHQRIPDAGRLSGKSGGLGPGELGRSKSESGRRRIERKT